MAQVFLSQSCSIVDAKPITFQPSNENHSDLLSKIFSDRQGKHLLDEIGSVVCITYSYTRPGR